MIENCNKAATQQYVYYLYNTCPGLKPNSNLSWDIGDIVHFQGQLYCYLLIFYKKQNLENCEYMN